MMWLEKWIPIIAATCTVVEAVFGPIRTHFWPAISDALRRPWVRMPWSATRRALDRIMKQAKAFDPNVIVGINRGGAIVGGMIAKTLHLDPPILLDVDQQRTEVVIEQRDKGKSPPIEGRILLCDDACRSRDNLTSAVEHLRQHAKPSHLKTAVLLCMNLPKHAVHGAARKAEPDFVGKATDRSTLVLPWDPMDLRER